MELTDEMRATIDAGVLAWLATVDLDGQPNVSPKEVFAAHGDDLVIAHIASPRSVRNIRTNPRVAVAVIDVFDQAGWKFVGRATVLEPGDAGYEDVVAPLLAITAGQFPIKAVIWVEPTHADRIVAPSSWLFPDRPVEQVRAGVLARYGVREADPSRSTGT